MLTTMTYRMPNFTLEQKLFLLLRIHAVVDTVQDFRKDTNTTVHRKAVWADLVRAFNTAFPSRPPSSIGSLKTLWKRLKVECRAALQKRQEQQAAGLPVSALTQVQREVIALVPNLISCLEEADGDYTMVRGGSPGAVVFSGTNGNEHVDADLSQNDGAGEADQNSGDWDRGDVWEFESGVAIFRYCCDNWESEFMTHCCKTVDSKENLAINLCLATPTHPPVNPGIPPDPAPSPPPIHFRSHSSTSRASWPTLFHPSHAGSTSVLGSGMELGMWATNTDRQEVNTESAVPRTPAGGSAENSLPNNCYGTDSKWEVRRLELFELEHQQTMSLLLLQQCVWEEKRKAVIQKEKAARAKKRYYQAKLRKIGADVLPSNSDSEDSDHPQT